MKRNFILLMISFICILFLASAEAASVILKWDASEGATGYKIYYGNSSRVYITPVDVGNVLTHEIKSLDPDTYYFAATAYNQYGESDYSDEIMAVIPNPLPDAAVISLEMRDKKLWVKWPAYAGLFPTYGFRVFLDDTLVGTADPIATEYNMGEIANGFHAVVVKTWNEYGEMTSNEELITIENPPIPTTVFSGKIVYTFENGLLVTVDIVK